MKDIFFAMKAFALGRTTHVVLGALGATVMSFGQTGPHWQVTSTTTGAVTWSYSITGGTVHSGTSHLPPRRLEVAPPPAVQLGETLNESFSATGTVTAKWVDSNGQLAANPPTSVILQITASVRAGAPWHMSTGSGEVYNSVTAQATDPFSGVRFPDASDLFTNTIFQQFPYWDTHEGHPISKSIKISASGGIATYSLPMSATIAVTAPTEGVTGDVACGGGISAQVDDRTATIYRPGARGETVDADGTIHGDTIHSIDYASDTNPMTLDVINHFIPTHSGTWSMSNDPAWPYPNIEVKWDGLDASYDYTPEYSFDYSIHGCYLQRKAPVDALGTYTLFLTLRDLGDGVESDNKYLLAVHHPGENWKLDHSTISEITQPSIVREYTNLTPGAVITITDSISDTVTVSDQIDISINWSFPKVSPYLDLPLSTKYQRTRSNATITAQASSTPYTAPAGAVTARLWKSVRRQWDYGTISAYDADGLIGTVAADQGDSDNVFMSYGVKFYDINGQEIVSGH